MRTTEYASSPFLPKDEHEVSLRNFILLETESANPRRLVTGWIISYSGTQCFLYNLCNFFLTCENMYQLTITERRAPDDNEIHTCGFKVWNLLLVTLRTPRIWMWFRDQFYGCHPVAFKYQCRQIWILSLQHNYSLLLQHSYVVHISVYYKNIITRSNQISKITKIS